MNSQVTDQMEAEVLVERKGRVAVLTMNRPKQSNPIGWTLGKSLYDAFDALENDKDISAIVLTGAGKNFCAGGAMGETLGIHEIDVERQFEAFRDIAKAVSRIRNFALPVIGAINGAAVGGGAAIALACDISIAAEKSYFGFGFGPLGACAADLGIPYILPRFVGLMRARHILMTSAKVSAVEAKEYGMVLDVVSSQDLLERAIALAEEIASTSARTAMAATKRVLKIGETAEFEACLYNEQFVQTYFLHSEDHKRRLSQLLNGPAAK